MKTYVLLLTCVVLFSFIGAASAHAQYARVSTTPEVLAIGNAILLIPPRPDYSEAHWSQFSNAIVEALVSGKEAFQVAALQMIIQHGPRLDVHDGVFDVVRLYRDHDNDNLRRMAAVTLGSMKSDWAIDFLTRSIRFEKTPRVLHTVMSIVAAHQANVREANTPSLQVAENIN